jgi:hypothetical protein
MRKRFLFFAFLTLAVGGVISVYTNSEHFWDTHTKPITNKQLAERARQLGLNTPTAQTAPVPLDLSKPVRLARQAMNAGFLRNPTAC